MCGRVRRAVRAGDEKTLKQSVSGTGHGQGVISGLVLHRASNFPHKMSALYSAVAAPSYTDTLVLYSVSVYV